MTSRNNEGSFKVGPYELLRQWRRALCVILWLVTQQNTAQCGSLGVDSKLTSMSRYQLLDIETERNCFYRLSSITSVKVGLRIHLSAAKIVSTGYKRKKNLRV